MDSSNKDQKLISEFELQEFFFFLNLRENQERIYYRDYVYETIDFINQNKLKAK